MTMRPTITHDARRLRFAVTAVAALFLQRPSLAQTEEPAAPNPEPSTQPAGEAPPAAETPAKEEDAAARELNKKNAKEAYDAGRKLWQKQQWAGALLQYEAAVRMYPTSNALTSMGTCLVKLQRHDEALEAFGLVMRRFGDKLSPRARDAVLEQIDIIRKETGAFMVTGAAPGALVFVDGRLRGEHPLPAPVATVVGRHLVRVYKEGFVVHEQDVDIPKGAMTTLAVTLKPLENAGRLKVGEVAGKRMEVVVDGVPVGVTPWEGPVSPGPHAVVLRPVSPRADARQETCGDEDAPAAIGNSSEASDLGTEPVTVVVESGKVSPLTLKAESLGAVVRVMPNPPTAEVFIDGVSVGRGPYTGRAREGKHVIKLVADGYFPAAEEVESKPGALVALAPRLEKDLNAARWAARGQYVVEGRAGVVLAPSLGGDIASSCDGLCQQTLGVGARAALRAGYELPIGLGFGLSAGYFSMEQTVTGRPASILVDGDATGISGTANDVTKIDAFALGAHASYRLVERFPVRVGLGAGVLLGRVEDSRVGIFENRAVGAITQSGFFPLIYVEPEVDAGIRIMEGLSVGVSFSGMLVVAPSIPRWTQGMSVYTHSDETEQFGTFEPETILGATFFTMTQAIHVRYGF